MKTSKCLMAVVAAVGVMSVQSSAFAQPWPRTFFNGFETATDRAAWSFSGTGNPHSFVNSQALSDGSFWHVLFSADNGEWKIIQKNEVLDDPNNPDWAVCQTFFRVWPTAPTTFNIKVLNPSGGTLISNNFTATNSLGYQQLVTGGYNPTPGDNCTVRLTMFTSGSFESTRVDNYKTECVFQ
jgi:hypothetical protein